MTHNKNRRVVFTLPGRIFRHLEISWLGFVLGIIYLIWAFFLFSTAMNDGLSCPVSGGSIVTICGDFLLFVVATLPISFVADLIGIKPNGTSFLEWIVYIGLCLILVYFMGFYIQKIVVFSFNTINRSRKP